MARALPRRHRALDLLLGRRFLNRPHVRLAIYLTIFVVGALLVAFIVWTECTPACRIQQFFWDLGFFEGL